MALHPHPSAPAPCRRRAEISVTSGAAITVSGFKDVTIRNVLITFGPSAKGISFGSAPGLTITNASLQLVGAKTSSGALPSASAVAIAGSGSANVRIDGVRVEGSSSGVYLLSCPGAHVSRVEGHNMRGPMPRGQCLQFDKSNNSLLEDFSCENDNSSFTEDNINVFESNNVTVRRGNPLTGCFLALGSGLRLVGTASSRR